MIGRSWFPLLFLFVGLVFGVCYWQQEIIDISISSGLFSYNFGGFGDFGLAWYSWRDIWMVVELVDCLFFVYVLRCFDGR